MKAPFKFKAYPHVEENFSGRYKVSISVKEADLTESRKWVLDRFVEVAGNATGVMYHRQHFCEKGRYLVGVTTTERAAKRLNRVMNLDEANINDHSKKHFLG